MIEFIKKNYVIITYVILSVFLEIMGLVALGYNPFIYKPWFGLTLLGITTSILIAISSNKVRYYLSTIFLVVQGAINLVLIVIFDMTGTVFDYGMFNLRSDAMGILEAIPLNFLYLFVFVFVIASYFIFVKRGLKYIENSKNTKKSRNIKLVSILIMFALNVGVMIGTNKDAYDSDYTKKLYMNGQGKYQEYGITGNFINELYKFAFYNDVKLGSVSEMKEYIYQEVSTPTSYFGVSEGNNVVTILVESLEWFSFIQDASLYPNALTKYMTQEEINSLYPNLTRFMSESVVMNNNYAREKTDISENDSLLGSYPTNAYINYDFPDNEMPFSVVNMLRTLDEDMVATSFHNGTKTFYNRSIAHQSLGFDKYYADVDLLELEDEEGNQVMTDWFSEGVRNLDSEMFEAAKDLMFIEDERFYTYIISITMHGMYYERENLQEHYKTLDKVLEGKNINRKDEMLMATYYYMGCVMEFDKALGVMFEDLEKKNLLDNTTIVLFGDHNTYYQGLSNYVKDIYGYDNENYTNLYRVPMMIYDTKLVDAIENNNESTTINKFTTTYDIVPTILDLMGVKYYTNFYFGHSVFDDKESVLYSRAYNIFLRDNLYLYSMNNILYKGSNITNEEIAEFEEEAKKLLTKLSHIDRIFYNDFFARSGELDTYITNVKNLNQK